MQLSPGPDIVRSAVDQVSNSRAKAPNPKPPPVVVTLLLQVTLIKGGRSGNNQEADADRENH